MPEATVNGVKLAQNVIPPGLGRFVTENVEKADYLFTRLSPNLFAYQHVFELVPRVPL